MTVSYTVTAFTQVIQTITAISAPPRNEHTVKVQNFDSSTPIYPDFYLLDTVNSRILCLTTDTFLPEGNPVVIVKMDNLAMHYAIPDYAVDRQNGKICAIYTSGWRLIADQATTCSCDRIYMTDLQMGETPMSSTCSNCYTNSRRVYSNGYITLSYSKN